MQSMTRIFIACTGAGAGAQEDLWRVPGCSDYFAGAVFPYGHDQLTDFLGFTPDQSCCEETAIHMAIAAYYRAWVPGSEAVGVGLTAAVASSKPRRGANRIHGAVMTSGGVWTRELFCADAHGFGEQARRVQGRYADHIVAKLIVKPERHKPAPGALAHFLSRPYWSATGQRLAQPPPTQTLFPGAFNPPHVAHLELAHDQRAAFWIEAQAPHKPALSLAELVQRAKLLHGHDRLFTSGAPLYLDKSARFPERPFIIGSDAFLRMLDPKWGPRPEQVLRDLSLNGTTLLIVGRKVGDRFMSADEAIASVPESGTLYDLKPLVGRWDVSSTEIRKSA